MAKKSRKPARTVRKAARKPAKKPSKASLDPVRVSTGKGQGPLKVGQALVARVNSGQLDLTTELWSKDIESVEGHGTSMAWRGRKAVDAKNAWWTSDHTIHGASAEGPYIGATGFAVKFRMDVETKSTGAREWMEEIGVYTVKDGKIVREEFMGFAPAHGLQIETKPAEALLARM